MSELALHTLQTPGLPTTREGARICNTFIRVLPVHPPPGVQACLPAVVAGRYALIDVASKALPSY